jgi:hypothetical protein
MSLRKFLYRKRFKDEQLVKDAHHEAGHAIMAYLVPESCVIKEITINSKKAKDIHQDNRGHLHVGFPITLFPNIEYNDMFVAVGFAGMCAQNLFVTSESLFTERIPLWVSSPDNHMDTEGTGEDMDLIKLKIHPVLNYLDKDYSEYRIEIMTFVFNYLSHPRVWPELKLLAQKLLLSNKLTLTSVDIQTHFEKTGFSNFIKENRDTIRSNRYPLPKKKGRYFGPRC